MESHQRDHENYVACSRSHRRRAKALLDFERHDDDELGFRKNDIITVRCGGHQGAPPALATLPRPQHVGSRVRVGGVRPWPRGNGLWSPSCRSFLRRTSTAGSGS